MSAVDHLIVGGIVVAAFGGALMGLALLHGVERADAPPASALVAEHWTPCEPPRVDVECWRSGHAVVCLPVQK